jgi:predicted PurR-regulated permease PerM
MTIGGAIGLYAADVARAVDETVRQLPESRGDIKERAKADLLAARGRTLAAQFLIAIALTVIGVAVLVASAPKA